MDKNDFTFNFVDYSNLDNIIDNKLHVQNNNNLSIKIKTNLKCHGKKKLWEETPWKRYIWQEFSWQKYPGQKSPSDNNPQLKKNVYKTFILNWHIIKI